MIRQSVTLYCFLLNTILLKTALGRLFTDNTNNSNRETATFSHQQTGCMRHLFTTTKNIRAGRGMTTKIRDTFGIVIDIRWNLIL